MTTPICEDGQCGACALCVDLGAGEPLARGTLDRVRLAVDLAEPELTRSLWAAPLLIGVTLVVALVFLVAHGASHLSGDAGLALALAAGGALWARRSRYGRALIALAPLPLLATIAAPSLALGSVGCLITELGVLLPGAIAGAVALRKGRASLAGWALGLGVGGVMAATAVHAGCPGYQELGHVVAFHVAPAVLLVWAAPRLARSMRFAFQG